MRNIVFVDFRRSDGIVPQKVPIKSESSSNSSPSYTYMKHYENMPTQIYW